MPSSASANQPMIKNSAKDSPKQRCAIYTRSSTEVGSNNAFHTVNAQFTACAEYIGSQVGRGWRLVDALYEDRGYSGSHLRRPGLQSVLANIRYGLIDVLVVYWVADFAIQRRGEPQRRYALRERFRQEDSD